MPAYQDYIVRTKVSEGLVSASAAKTTVSEAYMSDALPGLARVAAAWNLEAHSSKYVNTVTIAAANGMVTVTYNPVTTGILPAASNVYELTPGIVPVAGGIAVQLPAAVNAGNIDWACAGQTAGKAATVVAGVVAPANGVPAKFSSSECR